MDNPIPKNFGKYRIIERLGRGGMGEVFKAYDPGLERHVAIKTLHSHMTDMQGLDWLRREAAVVAKLRHPNIVQVFDFDSDDNQYYMVMEFIDGPTLRQKLDFGLFSKLERFRERAIDSPLLGGHPVVPDRVGLHRILDERFNAEELHTLCYYLGIDYDDLQGIGQVNKARALLQYLERHNRINDLISIGKEFRPDIPWDKFSKLKGKTTIKLKPSPADEHPSSYLTEIAQIFTELGNAIDYAHSKNMIHHDLKPANIMFTTDEQVVLTDFGIARILGVDYTASDIFTGTPPYMSPEQCRGIQDDPRSDIYSLGVILYETVTGKLPFHALDVFGYIDKHVNESVPSPSKENPNLPLAVEQVILTALTKDPNGRYQKAGEMMNALRTAVGLTEKFSGIVKSYSIDWSHIEPPSVNTAEPPFQAPHDILHFVGRETQLEQIGKAITETPAQNFFCLTGMGGVGKTALAIHLAHRLRNNFPDGILWANLAASEPLAILDSWARAFDFDFSGLPDLNSRAAALRGELAYKKILFVLDDVWSADQVREILPSGQNHIVLITTRDLDLPLVLDAKQLPVSVLTATESRQLIQIAGEVRADEGAGETAVIDTICELLGHLPLAVRIAARLLASRYQANPESLIARLQDENRRLATLKIRDREVRASFSVSWEALDDELRRVFSLLAVFEGRPFRVSALATIAQIDRITAEDHLYALLSLSLVMKNGRSHYRQHPLLADFAREHLQNTEEAYARMSQYYLAFAQRYQDNYAALDQEWDNLLSAMRIARQQAQWHMLIDYTDALNKAWFARGRFSDARQGYKWAVEAATALEDHSALATNLCWWGQACIEQSNYDEAKKHLSQSLQVCTNIEDLTGIAKAQFHLARIAMEQSEYDRAQDLLADCKILRQQLGDTVGVAATLYRQARILARQNDYEKVEALCLEALTIQKNADDKAGTIQTLRLLARINILRGGLEEAEIYCLQGLTLCLDLDLHQQRERATTLYTLSVIYSRKKELEKSQKHLEESKVLFERMGNRKMQGIVLHELSGLEDRRGNLEAAVILNKKSIEIIRTLDDKYNLVYVLLHLSQLYFDLSKWGLAQSSCKEALQLAEEINHAETENLHQLLRDITHIVNGKLN